MSITGSTTTIDTAWSESDFVAYTGGVLADLDAIVSEIQSKSKRTFSTTSEPTLAQVQKWAKRAKAEIATIMGFQFTRRRATCSTVAAQYVYSMPPDYGGGAILTDLTNDYRIPIWPKGQFDLKYPDISEENSSQPIVAAIKNMELWIGPPPAGVYSLALEYLRTGDDETTTDFSWLPELERWRCVDYALYELYETLEQPDKAEYFLKKYALGMKGSRQRDGKKKWYGKRYMIQNVFQEYAANSYQQKYSRP